MLHRPAGTSRIVPGSGAGAMAALLVVALSTAGVSAAQAAAASEKQAREHFQKAEMSFNLGRFPEALADYQAAYEAKPLPPFLFNIAQCYRNMQNYERARFFFRRYLALDPKTTNRRLVDDLIAEMSRAIDKQEKAEKSEAAVVDPPVVVASTPPPAPAPSPAPVPALAIESAAVPPTDTHRPVYKRWWFWSGAGAVVAGAVVAGILIARSGNSPSLGTIDGRRPPSP